MFHRLSYLFAISVFAITSCSDDEIRGTQKVRIDLSVDIDDTYTQTRSSKSHFTKGDVIGFYLVNYKNNYPGKVGTANNFMNVEYMFDGNSWDNVDGDNAYLDDATMMADAYVYHPFDYEMSRSFNKMDLSAFPFSVKQNQASGLQKSDFLWGKYTQVSISDPGARVTFRHLLSKIVIHVSADVVEDFPVMIHNLENSCTIDMNDGKLTLINGKISEIKPFTENISDEGYSRTYGSIVVPQTIKIGTPLFSIIRNDGTMLVYHIDHDLHMEQGKAYIFNLLIGKAKKGNL